MESLEEPRFMDPNIFGARVPRSMHSYWADSYAAYARRQASGDDLVVRALLSGPISVWSDETRIIKMLEFARRVRGSLLRLPYRDTRPFLRSYDTRARWTRERWNDHFFKLWSVNENFSQYDRNEKSQRPRWKRAAFIYKNR